MAGAAQSAETAGMKQLLATYFLGDVRIGIDKLVRTTIGREQRESGVLAMKGPIADEGFLDEKAPLVCLMKPLSTGQTLEAAAATVDFRLKIIDGNHRVSAALEIDKDNNATAPMVILVRVHSPMPPNAERMVAAGFNRITANVVPTVLVDNIVWYRSVVRAIQEADNNKKNLSETQLEKAVRADFNQQKQKPPAKQTLLKWIGVALYMSPRALTALQDVSFLPGRAKNHVDRNNIDPGRVTIKMVSRKDFHTMIPEEQEVYIYRLARGTITTNKILSDEQCLQLDDEAKTVGAEVGRVERIAAQSSWTLNFKNGMKKLMMSGLKSRYYMHEDGLSKTVETYKKNLPTGLEPNEDHVDMLLGQPHHTTVKIFKDDPVMKPKWDTYNAKLAASVQKATSDKTAHENTSTEAAKTAADTAAGATASAGAAPTPPAAESTPASASTDAPASPSTPASGNAPASTPAPPVTSDGETAGADKVKGKAPEEGTGGGTKRKRTTAAAAPKIDAQTANQERVDKLREAVAKVRDVDPLASSWNVSTDGLDAADASIMLAFLNIADDTSILVDDGESSPRLLRVLTEIAGALHARGSLAIAMESTVSFNFKHLQRVLKEVGLEAEAFPIMSVYLAKQAGRLADKTRLHHSRQASSVVLAHKTTEFPCHAVQKQLDTPRLCHSEAVGVVFSPKHPASSTFLSQAMADYLLNRFTAAGDTVMVTAFENNPLARQILGNGRHLHALVGDPAKRTTADKQIRSALATAITGGWFHHLAKADVILSGTVLPQFSPADNLSEAARHNLATEPEKYNDDEASVALAVAQEFASEFGLEIRDDSGQHGVWATDDLPLDQAVPMFAQGRFAVMDDTELISTVLLDGIQRYSVCSPDLLRSRSAKSETGASENSSLVVELDPTGKSSASAATTNVERSSVFDAAKPTKDTAHGLLVDAKSGVAFRTSCGLKQGQQLLGFYPTREHMPSGEDDVSDASGVRRSKRQAAGKRDGVSEAAAAEGELIN